MLLLKANCNQPMDIIYELLTKNILNPVDFCLGVQLSWIFKLADNPALLPEYEKYLNQEYNTLQALGFVRDETKESYVKDLMNLARQELKAIHAENN